MRSKVKKFFLITILLLIAVVVVLELLSRRPCASLHRGESPCSDLLYKYVFEPTGSVYFTYPEEKAVSLSDMQDPEFEKKMFDETFYVPLTEVRANGRVCMGYAYVAQELPAKAKRYVTYHENIHLTGEYNETRTNYLAARVEPAGFLQTIIYSVYANLKPTPQISFFCKLGMLWNVFKMYFLNINP